MLVGFLSQTDTFSVDLPDDVLPAFSQLTAVGLTPRETLSVQCAPAAAIDFASFGWSPSFQIAAHGVDVTVYECDDPPNVIMPVWDLESSYVWMQLRGRPGASRHALLATFVDGLRVTRDDFDIPRVDVTSRLVFGNAALSELNRDHVLFECANSTHMLVLRYDGPFSREGFFVDGDFAWAAATSPLGITVQRDGSPRSKSDLISETDRIASSVRKISRRRAAR